MTRKWHPDSIVLLLAFVVFALCLLVAIVLKVDRDGYQPSRMEWTAIR